MRNGQITANIEVAANSGKLSSSFSLSFCTLMPGGEWVMRCKLFRKRRESSSKLVNSIETLWGQVVDMKPFSRAHHSVGKSKRQKRSRFLTPLLREKKPSHQLRGFLQFPAVFELFCTEFCESFLKFRYSFSEDDAKLMASIGYNTIRLGVLWAGLEPIEGQYNMTYLEQVRDIPRTKNHFKRYSYRH